MVIKAVLNHERKEFKYTDIDIYIEYTLIYYIKQEKEK